MPVIHRTTRRSVCRGRRRRARTVREAFGSLGSSTDTSSPKCGREHGKR
jgi:hypothetical protein